MQEKVVPTLFIARMGSGQHWAILQDTDEERRQVRIRPADRLARAGGGGQAWATRRRRDGSGGVERLKASAEDKGNEIDKTRPAAIVVSGRGIHASMGSSRGSGSMPSLGSKADLRARMRDIRFTAKSGHAQRRHQRPMGSDVIAIASIGSQNSAQANHRVSCRAPK